MSAHIATLQEQVEQLFANLQSLRTQVDTQSIGSMGTPFTAQDYSQSLSASQAVLAPPSPTEPRNRHRRFHGPTSSAFSLGVASTSLQTMGITAPGDGEDEGVVTQDVTPFGSPPPAITIPAKPALHAEKDPIWSLSKHEALRLVHVWQEEIGMMYPFMDIDQVLSYAEVLFSFVEAATRSGLMQPGKPGSDAIMDNRTSNLKLILAIALILEGNGKDPLGEKLFENVRPVVDKTLSGTVDLQGINMLIFTGMYYFHRDDEALAWRTIGLAARQCLELGLHRRETYTSIFPTPEEQAGAIRSFWSVYVLDRRWSFGTGMPFVLQDADIDPDLPKPVSLTGPGNASILTCLIGRQHVLPQCNDLIQCHRFQGVEVHS